MGVGSAREDWDGGWVPAPVVTGVGLVREDDGWDGSPHSRGQWEGVNSCLRLYGGGFCVGGWVPACARAMGGDGGAGGF